MNFTATVALATTAVLARLVDANRTYQATRLHHIHPHYNLVNDGQQGYNYSPNSTRKHDEEIHEIATSFIDLLESDGFDMANKNDLMTLASFLETITGGEIAPQKSGNGFLTMLKKGGRTLFEAGKDFAKKHAKGAVGDAVKIIFMTLLKKGLPVFEKAYENAMQKIPIDLRITYAPMAYNLWTELFKKFKIRMPEGYNVERFICKAMTKEQCDDVIKRIKSKQEDEEAPQLRGGKRRKSRNDDDDDEEEDDGENDSAEDDSGDLDSF
ncbi:signal peptide-containing protein, putative [Babesia ovata]|uniref:Signal peptide-containing protein, putative n=1 Tax=Babesia ovata TaxID=189622 RepID=A0A2H6KEG1_9APIC|nr:signal peptide-containing protein, putative [Babesia ovata]GBE61375.1 signal peptide-containing protein, putative [Babesia ovata]